MIIESILGALVPVGVEGLKQVISKFTGGPRPSTVEEQIKYDDNEIKKLNALATLDTPVGQPSQWVVDLRASARYVGALIVIVVGIGSLFISGLDPKVQTLALEAANIAFGFLFGTRILANFKR